MIQLHLNKQDSKTNKGEISVDPRPLYCIQIGALGQGTSMVHTDGCLLKLLSSFNVNPSSAGVDVKSRFPCLITNLCVNIALVFSTVPVVLTGMLNEDCV